MRYSDIEESGEIRFSLLEFLFDFLRVTARLLCTAAVSAFRYLRRAA